MFSTNKPSLWLEKKHEDGKVELINEAMKSVSKALENYKRRLAEIEANQKRGIKENIRQLEFAECKLHS